MFTVSTQTNVYSILNNWCICIKISCGLGTTRCVNRVGGAGNNNSTNNNNNNNSNNDTNNNNNMFYVFKTKI